MRPLPPSQVVRKAIESHDQNTVRGIVNTMLDEVSRAEASPQEMQDATAFVDNVKSMMQGDLGSGVTQDELIQLLNWVLSHSPLQNFLACLLTNYRSQFRAQAAGVAKFRCGLPKRERDKRWWLYQDKFVLKAQAHHWREFQSDYCRQPALGGAAAVSIFHFLVSNGDDMHGESECYGCVDAAAGASVPPWVPPVTAPGGYSIPVSGWWATLSNRGSPAETPSPLSAV